MQQPIAIIGAGPCGLTLARLLERNNIDYVVFEQDRAETPEEHRRLGQGGSLDLHPKNGLKALEAAGLLGEFKKHARYDATQFVLVTQDAEIKLRVGEGREAPEIDRTRLRQMLLDSVPSAKIRWEHGVKSVVKHESGHGRAVKFANGTRSEAFQLVVGADGAWSKVRPLLTSAKPIYSGVQFIEARISPNNPSYPSAHELAGKGMMAALGSSRALIVQQMADASYRVYMGIRLTQDFARTTDFASKTEALRKQYLEQPEYFADWNPKLRKLIADAEGPFRPWSLYSLAVEAASWPHVRGVALLGDAAHLTTPNGEGVNAAMYDSLVLAEKIVKNCTGGQVDMDGLDRAVVEYEEDMFPRAKEHIEDGSEMIGRMFAEDAVDQWLQLFEAAMKGH